MPDSMMKTLLGAFLVVIMVGMTSLLIVILPDLLEALDNCKEAIRKRKNPKVPEAAAVKIVTKEASVQTLKASRYVDNSIVEKMPPEEVERIVVTCLSEKLAEGIVPFMEVRSEKVQYGNGTMFTAEIMVVDTGSGLGRCMEEKSNG